MRYQQVYSAAEFAARGPGVIARIAFRPDRLSGRQFSETIGIQVALSVSDATPDDMSLHFSDNLGTNTAIVYDGRLFLSSALTSSNSGPKDFDISIDLQEPFYYDPSQGSLVLDIQNYSSDTRFPSFDAELATDDTVSRAFATSVVAPRGVRDSLGLVTQFTFEVPESASVALLALLGVAKPLVFSRRLR